MQTEAGGRGEDEGKFKHIFKLPKSRDNHNKSEKLKTVSWRQRLEMTFLQPRDGTVWPSYGPIHILGPVWPGPLKDLSKTGRSLGNFILGPIVDGPNIEISPNFWTRDLSRTGLIAISAWIFSAKPFFNLFYGTMDKVKGRLRSAPNVTNWTPSERCTHIGCPFQFKAELHSKS